jgi:hypothetical protein
MDVKTLFTFSCVLVTVFNSNANFVGKYVLVLDEKVDNCAEPGKDAKAWDISDYQVLTETDTESYLNGSFKFLRHFNPPIQMRFYAERFERGQWNVMYLDQKRKDFCSALLNPSEFWYAKMHKLMDSCPIKAGVRTE